MRLKGPIAVPPLVDTHVHLRQDPAMVALAANRIREGGANIVYVMPNLNPPLTTVESVTKYHERLQARDPHTTYLMTLYLHESLTPDTIAAAASVPGGFIRGVKAYPAGVTTGSASGVTDWSTFNPVFAAMEEHDLILNIHGEVPGADVLVAEAAFLPMVLDIHARFPQLRIVLEHVSTAAAVEAVHKCGPNVMCTITAHHLLITQADWAAAVADSAEEYAAHAAAHNWCKPAAKTDADRRALLEAIKSPKAMLGSDSAPHPAPSKQSRPPPAGCFTQGWIASHVLIAIEDGVGQGWLTPKDITQQVLEGFLGGRARTFLRLPPATDHPLVVLERKGEKIPALVSEEVDGERADVVPFHAGEECWSVWWETRPEGYQFGKIEDLWTDSAVKS